MSTFIFPLAVGARSPCFVKHEARPALSRSSSSPARYQRFSYRRGSVAVPLKQSFKYENPIVCEVPDSTAKRPSQSTPLNFSEQAKLDFVWDQYVLTRDAATLHEYNVMMQQMKDQTAESFRTIGDDETAIELDKVSKRLRGYHSTLHKLYPTLEHILVPAEYVPSVLTRQEEVPTVPRPPSPPPLLAFHKIDQNRPLPKFPAKIRIRTVTI